MDYQRHKTKDALTIEQQEGYIIALQDRLIPLKKEIENLKDSIKWRKKFSK